MLSSRKILLVGLGGIGCQYDLKNPKVEKENQFLQPLTHYSAAIQNGHKVIGGVDLDSTARSDFESFTSLRTWQSINEIKELDEVDILVISTPTSSHREQFKIACEKLRPKAILFEKPFGSSAQESAEMIEISKRLQIPIIVNYSRNFSRGFQEIRTLIKKEDFESGSVLYAQGLRENGSHFLRLIIELFGTPTKINLDSYRSSSPNPSFTVFFPNCKSIRFIGSESTNIRLGEIFLETSMSAIRISEGMSYEIRQINDVLKPLPWFREYKLINQGELSGGLNELYRDTKWANIESIFSCIQRNYLDLECNRIIDEILIA